MRAAVRLGALALVLSAWAWPASAQSASGVSLAGRMGARALLVIDGRAHAMAVGDSVAGVRLAGWDGDAAQVEIAGRLQSLRIGAAPAVVTGLRPPPSGREIVIPAGQDGHFTTTGSIRGHSMRFMVDTGATLVAMGRNDAQRMGLDLSNAKPGFIQTANGQVLVQMVTLPELRVGDVEVVNVNAVVLPSPMPYVLLGNNFLSRFQMLRENDVMRLQAR